MRVVPGFQTFLVDLFRRSSRMHGEPLPNGRAGHEPRTLINMSNFVVALPSKG